MSEYGSIFTKSSTKSQLKELNKNYEGRKMWQELYASADLAKQSMMEDAEYSYSSDVAEAYKVAQLNKNTIAFSNLGTGYKEELMSQLDNDLMQAYNSYKQNKLGQLSTIAKTSANQINSITEALDTQAENTTLLANSTYDYLQYLYDRAYNEDNPDMKLQDLFNNNMQWNKFLQKNELLDAEGNVMVDEEGNALYDTSLRDMNALKAEHFDKNGNITIKGMDFYDQMINQLGIQEGSDYGYYKWLNDTNPELYEWSQTYNPYDYTEAGTNIGSFKTLFGMTSTDEKYEFIERFGGLNEEEIDTMFSKFKNNAKTLSDAISTSNIDEYATNVKNITNELKSLANDLGMEDDFGEIIGGWDNLNNILDDYYSGSISTDELNAMIQERSITDTLSYTGLGASAGAIGGSVVPGIGTAIGAVAGGIVGALTALISSISYESRTKKYAQQVNENYANKMRDEYVNLVTKMTEYAQLKRRNVEMNYNKK